MENFIFCEAYPEPYYLEITQLGREGRKGAIWIRSGGGAYQYLKTICRVDLGQLMNFLKHV